MVFSNNDEMNLRVKEFAKNCHHNHKNLIKLIDEYLQKEFQKSLTINFMERMKFATDNGFCGFVLYYTTLHEHGDTIKQMVSKHLEKINLKQKLKILTCQNRVVVMLPKNLLHNYKYNRAYHWIAPTGKNQYWGKKDIDNDKFLVETNYPLL